MTTKQIQSSTGVGEKCPPLLAELIQLKGEKKLAAEAIGVKPSGLFYEIIAGRKPAPSSWEPRIKAALGHSVIGHNVEEPTQAPASNIPEFVPWDGKTLVTVQMNGKSGGAGRKLKLPPTVAALVQMHSMSRSAAALSTGHTSGWLEPILVDPKKKFNEKAQRSVHNALHGVKPPLSHALGEDYDKYQLGMAIILTKGANFDRIHELAEFVSGRLIFKKNTSGGWLLIYRMATEDLPKFKRLAMRDASEIVCP